ncbi:hypothetical protein KFK09_005510 [Dendrobium nobile]|uniref:Uncharacterized protein n=1 Tax=Dendrobium nobile TaxID=94219 RepID=A0A8T3BVV9_DENNO|nr:hypothetical protein KFK09_005510 [Dendrobium nobile]
MMEYKLISYTYPIGRGIEADPMNSPSPIIFILCPNIILHLLKNDTVQNGLMKS